MPKPLLYTKGAPNVCLSLPTPTPTLLRRDCQTTLPDRIHSGSSEAHPLLNPSLYMTWRKGVMAAASIVAVMLLFMIHLPNSAQHLTSSSILLALTACKS